MSDPWDSPVKTDELSGTCSMEPKVQRRLKKMRVLGKGTYGTAHLVQDEDTGEEMVQKEVNLVCMKPKDLENTLREVDILQQVNHPNVVRYIDSWMAYSVMYILMEYCDGGDLARLIKNNSAASDGQSGSEGKPPFTEETVACIMIQLLMAMNHLHERRILHRDLKPQNIFLMADGTVKIGDFGVSTVLQQSVEFAKTFCGTPYYLAPEICEEAPYNVKADLWAIGCILYEMMSGGRRPFSARNLIALVGQITKGDYDPLPTSYYSHDLISIVHSFLNHLPLNRPTVRRVLRSPYVGRMMMELDSRLLYTPEYESVLKVRERMAKMQQEMLKVSGGTPLTPVTERERLEMEAWANRDRQLLEKQEGKPLDQLTDLEKNIMRRMHRRSTSDLSNDGNTSMTTPVGEGVTGLFALPFGERQYTLE